MGEFAKGRLLRPGYLSPGAEPSRVKSGRPLLAQQERWETTARWRKAAKVMHGRRLHKTEARHLVENSTRRGFPLRERKGRRHSSHLAVEGELADALAVARRDQLDKRVAKMSHQSSKGTWELGVTGGEEDLARPLIHPPRPIPLLPSAAENADSPCRLMPSQ